MNDLEMPQDFTNALESSGGKPKERAKPKNASEEHEKATSRVDDIVAPFVQDKYRFETKLWVKEIVPGVNLRRTI